MQFINIVVHSVEDMNFRVHLQYEFTKLGLEEFLQVQGGRGARGGHPKEPPPPFLTPPQCLAEVKAHGEREAAGADPGVPGQRL